MRRIVLQCCMRYISATVARLLFLLVLTFPLQAQVERQVPPPDRDELGKRFFDQLHNLFGRFRDTDLRRAFDAAQPVPCSELISDDGEWRPVAFFNEDRKLGDWYHSSLEEVKDELSTYIFKGTCRTDQSSIQLVTKFPVRDSMDRYNDGRIHFKEIAINVNAPVSVSFDSRSGAYRFDLPYLYAVRERGVAETVYSLMAQSSTDHYATNVINQWDCKSVHANDVTFQFIICDTQTSPAVLDPRARVTRTFGASAYFILSDGKEALTSTKLSFGDLGGETAPAPPATDRPAEPEPTRAAPPRSTAAAPATPLADTRPEIWQIPGPQWRLLEVARGDFRIRYNPQTWANKVGTPQVLMDEKIVSLALAKPGAGVDNCLWRPASASLSSRLLSSEPDKDIDYTLTTSDGDKLSPVSFSFDMKTHTGSKIGTLQCFFPKADSAEAISVDRWVSIVGGHVTLEIVP